MLTKKHYIRAAEIVRESGASGAAHSALVEGLSRFFRDDNPRFDFERFARACDPVAPTIQARHNTRPRPARTGFDS